MIVVQEHRGALSPRQRVEQEQQEQQEHRDAPRARPTELQGRGHHESLR